MGLPKWWPICGQSISFSFQVTGVYRTRFDRGKNDWPQIGHNFWQTHIFTILWFALRKQKWWPICGQSFLTLAKLVLYTLATWKENEMDWPQIGRHFGKPIYSLYYGSLCGSKNDGQSVANHFWLCKSKSYILLLLEKRMKLIGHRLAIIFASAERTIV